MLLIILLFLRAKLLNNFGFTKYVALRLNLEEKISVNSQGWRRKMRGKGERGSNIFGDGRRADSGCEHRV